MGHSLVSLAGIQYNLISGWLKEGAHKNLTSRLRRPLKRALVYLSTMDGRSWHSGAVALFSLGFFGAAFRSDWSYSYLGAALLFSVWALYTWPRPRRRKHPR